MCRPVGKCEYHKQIRKSRPLVVLLYLLTLLLPSCSVGSTTTERQESADLAGKKDIDAAPTTASGWYNMPVLRAIFGDFDKVPALSVIDPDEKKQLKKRGQYLVKYVAACGACHALNPTSPDSPLAGGREMADRYGKVSAPNITAHPLSGIGSWNIADIMRAIRASIDKEGRPLSLDLHSGYRWMADFDARAIAVYLQSTKPIHQIVERRHLGGFERNKWGIISQHQDFVGYVPEPVEADNAFYGRYLAMHIARCSSCHIAKDQRKPGTPLSAASKTKGVLSRLFSSFANLFSWNRDESQRASQEKGSSSAFSRSTSSVDVSGLNFPARGPELRSQVKFDPCDTQPSTAGSKRKENRQVLDYLASGTKISEASSGKKVDARYCPWPSFKGMTDRDKHAIALFYGR